MTALRGIRSNRRGTSAGGQTGSAQEQSGGGEVRPSQVLVREVMTLPVVQFAPEDTLAVALARLRNAQVSGGPVVAPDGRVIGVLSESDIARSVGARWLTTRPMEVLDLVLPNSPWSRPDALRDLREGLQTLTAKDAMTRPAEVVEATAPITEAVRRMKVRRVNRLPVVDQNRLVGILARRDLLGHWPVSNP